MRLICWDLIEIGCSILLLWWRLRKIYLVGLHKHNIKPVLFNLLDKVLAPNGLETFRYYHVCYSVHSYWDEENNFCRNPRPGDFSQPWCYIALNDVTIATDLCDIPVCTIIHHTEGNKYRTWYFVLDLISEGIALWVRWVGRAPNTESQTPSYV